jgi:hypothetical protein
VIPELVLEIGHIPQMGIEVAHHSNYGTCSLVSFFTVLDGFKVVHHLLDISSVFRKDQLLSAGVIIV